VTVSLPGKLEELFSRRLQDTLVELRRDLHEIPPDVGVVGGLVVLPVQEVPERNRAAGDRENGEHSEKKDSSLHCIATFAS